MQTSNFYVYTHARSNVVGLSAIFYVGKGCGKRAYDFVNNRNLHHRNTLAKYGSEVKVGVRECNSEKEALSLEKTLIGYLRNNGVSLTNQTDGGEGISGYKFTEESLTKLSVAQKRNNNLPERKLVQSKNSTENWKKPAYRDKVISRVRDSWTDERKLQMSQDMREFRMQPEERKANSERQKVALNRPEVRAKRVASSTGRVWICNINSESKFASKSDAELLVKSGEWTYGRKPK